MILSDIAFISENAPACSAGAFVFEKALTFRLICVMIINSKKLSRFLKGDKNGN